LVANIAPPPKAEGQLANMADMVAHFTQDGGAPTID
jgi:hypothetical protein|tara:strand:+ start:3719 stop:3826 length:108 start_codon:yes stop_codon:yes gene_type:complete